MSGGDTGLTDLLSSAAEPVGARAFARSFGYGNRVATTPRQLAQLPAVALWPAVS